MSVMNMNSRMAMAEKLSVQQLQQAVQSGSLPAYIGIPLIEQKTKEKAQMAAAQQGQQKPQSVAASILQQADEQEQQERGIDELPSNLPMMDGEEMGMANGGIIAFADRGLVQPDDDGLNPDVLERLREDDPGVFQKILRRVFGESDPTGGSSSSTVFTPSVRDMPFTTGPDTAGGVSLPFRRPKAASNAPTPTSKLNLLPEQNLSLLQAPDFEGSFADPKIPTTPQAPQPEVDYSINEQEGTGRGNAGITAAPGAKLAPDGTPSAPRTAPQGGGERGALPPTLAAAERSDSSAANQATSMLDRYVAMLEKSGEDVSRQKKEALYMALIQGGLAAAGGMSPNALQNIAQGATLGAQNYQQAIAGIRKEDRARLEKLISAGLKKEEFMLKAEEIGVKRETARMVYDASRARTGAMGGGADKQARLFAFNAGRELRQVESDVPKLKNTDEYKEAARVMNIPYDPKKSSPAIKQMREQAQSVINSVNQETTRRVQDARGAVDFYRGEAGLPPLYSGDTGGGAGGKYEVGRKYRDAKGNEAVYKGKDASGKDIWE